MEAKTPPTNTYKNGAISMGFGANMAWPMALSAANQQPANIPQRKFVTGEKFWVADYVVKDDGVVFQFYSDPFDNVRYYSQLKFPVSKGAFPPADNMMKTIALGQTKDEVVTILGKRQKIVNLGAKEMYFYPDMKVILVNGKVTDVQ